MKISLSTLQANPTTTQGYLPLTTKWKFPIYPNEGKAFCVMPPYKYPLYNELNNRMPNKPVISENGIGKVKIEIQIRGPLTKPRWNFEWLRNGDKRSKRKRIFGLSVCQSAIALTLEVYYPLTFQFWLEMVLRWLENKSPTFDGNLNPGWLKLIDRWIFIEWLIQRGNKHKWARPKQNNSFNYKRPELEKLDM